jgi:hypothetical protein
MNVGDTVEIPFAGGKKVGTVVKVSEKSVWVKVDFPRHPGKLVRRKIHQLQTPSTKGAKKTRRAKAKNKESA